MSRDWLFKSDDYICGVRTAGVLLRGDKILVQRDIGGEVYALPGGHIKIGETTEDALVREFREEMNVSIVCRRLLWTEEVYWQWNGRRAHNISFYYLTQLCDADALPDNGQFTPDADNGAVEFGWIPLDMLAQIEIYPAFISQEITSLEDCPRHFVSFDE